MCEEEVVLRRLRHCRSKPSYVIDCEWCVSSMLCWYLLMTDVTFRGPLVLDLGFRVRS